MLDFNKGTTLAHFQASGKTDVSIERLMMNVRAGVISSATSFKVLVSM